MKLAGIFLAAIILAGNLAIATPASATSRNVTHHVTHKAKPVTHHITHKAKPMPTIHSSNGKVNSVNQYIPSAVYRQGAKQIDAETVQTNINTSGISWLSLAR